jgi:hypothetical protein
MWEFLMGILFARATGLSRIIRALLLLFAACVVIVGAIYASVVFKTLQERSRGSHVHTHSTH